MVFSRGLVISLGVSALSATLLFLYFRNRMASVERKVDVMFDLIQSHESDRQQQMVYQEAIMRQQNNAPSSQNTGAWSQETEQHERNLIDVSENEDNSEGEDDSEGEYDSEDSKEVSDNEEDLEERIKLVTSDIDINVEQAEEVKNVEVLESNDIEPVIVDQAVQLEEVTLEEDTGSSGDLQNITQTADNNNNEADDSLEEDNSEDESDDDETQDVVQDVEYSKLRVHELKAIAEAKGLTNYKSLKKQPLIDLIKATE